ncbi:MAG: putative motility protein [Hydrogenophaga sp.]
MDMNISPALLVDRVLQTQHIQSTQDAQINLLKKAMDAQATASMALLNAVAGDLPLASDGSLGTQVNTLV